MRNRLRKEIENYIPFNEQEERDKELILRALKEQDIFYRTNTIAHMTASAWVLNEEHTKVLMAYHNIYDSYAWLGGHADGNEDLLTVAIQEVKEESGIEEVKAISEKIFSLESLTVDGHIKNGSYVSSHLHLNITYLLEASDQQPLHHKEDENKAVKWFSL
ncbi:MAG: NUDIX hydrolase, partial [Solobacterium sp.]|nr:NUDIX hydrolase [Solobacterium sp.]